MKRMVGIALIVALVLIAVVGVVCAEDAPDVRTDIKVYIPAADSIVNPESATVCHNEDFYYIASFTTTSPKLSVYIEEVNPLEVHFISNGRPYSFNCSPNISTGFKIKPSETVTVSFDTINFEGGFGKEIAKNVTNVRYDCSYTRCPDIPGNHSGYGPGVVPEPPEVNFMSYLKMVGYNEDFNIGVRVKDIIGSCSDITPDLRFINCSNNSDIRYPSSPRCKHREGTVKYNYIWTVSKFDKIFKKGDVGSSFEVNLTSYNNGEYNIHKTGPYPIKIVEYTPKIIDVKLNKISLSSAEWNNIYVEEEDLDRGIFPFEVTIEDKKGKGKVTLEKCKIIDSNLSNCTNYTLAYISSDGLKNCSGDIPFNQGDAYENFSLRLYYNRSKLPADWPSPWNSYNITIIPFYIKFENATVSHKTGNWSDTFNYSVDVNASKGLNVTITLRVFDPYREREPWVKLVAPDIDRIEEPPTFKWSDRKPFKNYCAGQSKFYFEYCIEEFKGESPVYLGPYLGDIPTPEFDNGSPNPNVTIYCNWSKSATPCNYSVNVSTEEEYKVRLLVKDPNSNDWIPKGDVKDVSRETKNITWTDITPFESLNMDNITQYIGNETCANFTFEYDGHKANKKFSGPLLVGAFKDLKIVPDPGNISYGDTFNCSVSVIGSEKLLNITLRYLCDGKWISDHITNATWNYTATGNWTPHTWECQAINTWEEARFDVNVTGEGKPIEVY